MRARFWTSSFLAVLSVVVIVVWVGHGYADSPAVSSNTSYLRPLPNDLSNDRHAAIMLGRAVDLWIKHDLAGAADLLQTIDISSTSSFAEADRAAFLLAVVSLLLDDVEAFHRVADRSGENSTSPYRRWIHYCQLIETSRGGYSEPSSADRMPDGLPGADILGAAILLESGRAREAVALLDDSNDSLASIRLYLKALAYQLAGDDPANVWHDLAKQKPNNALEADLIGIALLELSARRIEEGRDADDLLSRMPESSRHAARAQHLRVLAAIDAGDTTRAREMLDDFPVRHPHYGDRDVTLARGGLDMTRGNWKKALAVFRSAGDHWINEYESLGILEDEQAINDVWSYWEKQQRWREEIRLAPETLLALLAAQADKALNLGEEPSLNPNKETAEGLWPVFDRAPAPQPMSRHHPNSDEWHSLRVLQQTRRHSESVLARHQRSLVRQEQQLERRLSYLGDGRSNATRSEIDIADAVARLELILGHIDKAVDQLAAVRDSTLLDIAKKTRVMIEGFQRDLLFVQAMRHFHVEGPQDGKSWPPDVPTPDEVLTLETLLANEAAGFIDFFATYAPELIVRSFDQVWEPRLTGDTRELHDALLAELRRAHGIGSQLDSTLAWYANDPDLIAARARRDELAAAIASLRNEEHALRIAIARSVADRGRKNLAAEREAIDYHVADAAFEVAVQISKDPQTVDNPALAGPSRREAIDHLATFLERYPQSIARAESRFRLADMYLMQARDDFQIKMAEFLGRDPSADDLENRALAPFVDYSPAADLYVKILAEDADYQHIDGVLFNLGMILSDDGQASATEYLERLVRDYPDSPDAQEAWLRMGSERFDRKDYAGCVPYFEKAIAGDDPSFSAIALYKLGWALFEEDDFLLATDAFRRLMDVYHEHPDIAEATDLRDEAEEYLVHSLARSGGATAFSQYFDRIDERAYESRVLQSLAHLMRSHALYKEAIACDNLWLSRYELDAQALAVAERIVDAYKSWNKPDAAREIKYRYAPKFLRGSDWFKANKDDELRASADAFARGAYRETAGHYHHDARTSDRRDSWRSALENYETYLVHWPDATDAERIHFFAGEAASQLESYEASFDHFAVAAGSDSSALAMDAAWQQMAVADTWYRHVTTTKPTQGNDALGRMLLAAGDRFIAAYPTDERCADISWRQGNVAYSHGWYEEAAIRLTLMVDLFPMDPRSVTAMRMSGDAYYRLEDYDKAGADFEKTLTMARTAGIDSLVPVLEREIPLCYYKHAESVASADGTQGEQNAAPLFSGVAQRFPEFEHADLALYRAGLGFAARGSEADAVGAWNRLLEHYATSQYARDSAIQIALAHDRSGSAQSAAMAYERFSELYPEDPDAASALLKAVDLLAQSGDEPGAEQMRDVFMERFPGETETIMEIQSARATQELASVAAGTATVGGLLAGSATGNGASSALESYLEMAEKNPELASPVILAQVDYHKAQAAHEEYAMLRLTQPLPESIERKKASLEALLKVYDECTRRGVSEYSRASAFGIGKALIEFGDALLASERPSGLGEDDLFAYEDVLDEQSWEFYERGQTVWSELLQQVGDSPEDPGEWIVRTQRELWPRLGQRFLYQPEVEYPLVTANRPGSAD